MDTQSVAKLSDQERLKAAWEQLGILGKTFIVVLLLLPIVPLIKLPNLIDPNGISPLINYNADKKVAVTKASPTPTPTPTKKVNAVATISPTPTPTSPPASTSEAINVTDQEEKVGVTPTPEVNPVVTPTEEEKEENPGEVNRLLANIGELKLIKKLTE